MLAATPTVTNNTLDLFKLALAMIENGDTNIPDSLKEYFTEVLIQAKIIANDSNLITHETKPEAIELAVDIREFNEFLQILDNVNSIDNISQETAKNLLDRMEVQSVCQNGFSPITGIAS